MVSLAKVMQSVAPGRYVVAVSGGVDSMALLHAMTHISGVEIIAAHVNHGIRPDAHLDGDIVRAFCESHNILCVSTDLNLGPTASEALARKRRYEFLQKCLIKYEARAIVTAHHQNDAIETAVINILRGTGWRGIAPFASESNILRPLLYATKKDIMVYARSHNIEWREDSTNCDQAYLRNYVRLSIVPWMDAQKPGWDDEIMRYIRNQQTLRRTIDTEAGQLLSGYVEFGARMATSSRYIWCMLPDPEAYELFQALCRRVIGTSVLRDQAVAALLFIKVAKPGKHLELTSNWRLRVTRNTFIVEPR